jgi:hypothetical protein
MNDGTYKEGEPMQEIQLTIRCKVKHNPGTESHLKQLTISHFAPKGITVAEEEGKLITYV